MDMMFSCTLLPSALRIPAKLPYSPLRFNNPRISEGRGNMLPDATEQAIELLRKNKKGFFLMVEGSQIDWGGHNNDIQLCGGRTDGYGQCNRESPGIC